MSKVLELERDVNAAMRLVLNWFVAGSGAATAANTGYLGTAPFACRVSYVATRFSAAGSTGAALDILKVPSGTAVGSGTTVLSGTMALTGTADTIVTGGIATGNASAILKTGDSLYGSLTGTLTNLANLGIIVVLTPLVLEAKTP